MSIVTQCNNSFLDKSHCLLNQSQVEQHFVKKYERLQKTKKNQNQVKQLRIYWDNLTESVLYRSHFTVWRKQGKGKIFGTKSYPRRIEQIDGRMIVYWKAKPHRPIKSLLDLILKAANCQYSFHWSAIPILVFVVPLRGCLWPCTVAFVCVFCMYLWAELRRESSIKQCK